jgi:hypothetical protein
MGLSRDRARFDLLTLKFQLEFIYICFTLSFKHRQSYRLFGLVSWFTGFFQLLRDPLARSFSWSRIPLF